MLLDEGKRGKLLGWKDNDVCTDADWTLGDLFIEWTYVIDLDNRVFTVNGALHFKFDNMPPLRASGTQLGFVDYLEGPEDESPPEIPAEYLASIEFWPKLRYNAAEAQLQYDELHPIIAGPSEWDALTWDDLLVPQHLSISLVKILVDDYSDELALCCYPRTWARLGAFCWNIANAAALSHLLCPPADATPQSNTLYVFDINHPRKDKMFGPHPTTHYYLEHKGNMSRFYWFRGCLITICPRLDESAYRIHKIVQMVRKLRKHDRTHGVGIIMSGWHLVTVAINGSEVRHSPVLDLHDGKEPKDGILLLMHLLSPTFTRSKAPWHTPPPEQPHNTHTNLPDDIMHQIIHFTDFNTYTRLSLVSHYFRSICLAHPRIGDHILLGYEATPGSEHVFRVRSTSSTDSELATLKRIKASMPDSKKGLPLW
ncbi:hypothetical protein FRC11_000593, partial [Ceratobasidium sp. 423]